MVEKCRCEECTGANRDYQRERERRARRVSYGLEAPSVIWVDATEARDHVNWLRSVGVGRRAIARKTGLSQTTLHKLKERQKISKRTADKIMAVGKGNVLSGSFVDPGPYRDMIADLFEYGFDAKRIGKEVDGVSRAIRLNENLRRFRADRIASAYQRMLREVPEWHGTYYGYAKKGCRCRRCTSAARDYQRELRELRRK